MGTVACPVRTPLASGSVPLNVRLSMDAWRPSVSKIPHEEVIIITWTVPSIWKYDRGSLEFAACIAVSARM